MKVKISLVLLIATLVVINQSWSWGQTETDLNTGALHMDALAGTNQVGGTVVNKLIAEFDSLLGENANAAVINGLRNGTSFTLTSTAPPASPGGDPVITTTVINPTTGKTGYGNVFIMLALTKQQLGQVGISQPTPGEFEAALLGGTITTGSGSTQTITEFQGILALRAEGKGWGQISHELGFRLGDVISRIRSANRNQQIGTHTSSTSGIINAGGQAVEGTGKGIASGSGKSLGKNQGKALGRGIVDASGHSVREGYSSRAYGRGIVSGSGQVMGGSGGVHGHGYGRGIVSGSGRSAGIGLGHGIHKNRGRGKGQTK